MAHFRVNLEAILAVTIELTLIRQARLRSKA